MAENGWGCGKTNVEALRRKIDSNAPQHQQQQFTTAKVAIRSCLTSAPMGRIKGIL